MTSRIQFPGPTQPPAFVAVPFGVFAGMPAGQALFMQQVYRLAWEQTQAVLKPTRFERLYQACSN